VADVLGREQPDHGLGERIIVGIATAPDRRLDTGGGQALGAATGQVLRSAIAMANEPGVGVSIVDGLLNASSARAVRNDVLARLATMRCEDTSIADATSHIREVGHPQLIRSHGPGRPVRPDPGALDHEVGGSSSARGDGASPPAVHRPA
jgi:hypothetical protein